jgi:hypothetical protein
LEREENLLFITSGLDILFRSKVHESESLSDRLSVAVKVR